MNDEAQVAEAPADDKAAAKAAKAAAKAEADRLKAEKAAAREAAKAEKEQAKAVKEQAKAARVRQNGVLRPLPESKCGQAWALFDEASAAKGAPVTVAEVMAAAEERGLNAGNIRAEYNNWRKFYGVPPQRRAKAEAPATEAAPEAPAAPEAEAAPVADTPIDDGEGDYEGEDE